MRTSLSDPVGDDCAPLRVWRDFGSSCLRGLAYATPERLLIALGMTAALVVTLWLLPRYRATRSKAALWAFMLTVALIWVALLGLFEGGYNHAFKDALFLAGVSVWRAAALHPGLMAADYIYPPNDLFFEASGVLQLGAALFLLAPVHRLLVIGRTTAESVHEVKIL